MHNVEIAWTLKEISDLLEFKGENFFKIRAYRQAARTLASLPAPVEEMYHNGSLKNVPGIGKNILAKIGEMLATEKCVFLENLRAEIPVHVPEVMSVPGVGPKRARSFYEQLNISSLDDLEHAARRRKIRTLPGIGGKREQEILRGIKMIKANAGRYLLSLAKRAAAEFEDYFHHLSGVSQVSITGEVRRWCETVLGVDILVGTTHPGEILSTLDKHPLVANVLNSGQGRISLLTRWGIPVEILIVPPGGFFTALIETTGNSSHWHALQHAAQEQGMRLLAGGIFDQQGNVIHVSSEEDVYKQVGLSYVPPEIRENKGEIDLARAHKLPSLVYKEHIRGDLHIHSRWSDGRNTIEEMADRAIQKGYQYFAITDHSRSLKIAGGLSLKEVAKQQELITAVNKNLKGFRILKGVEVDILSNGDLDYPDEILAKMDIVIASVHTAFKQDRDQMTGRIMTAIENPHVNVIAHPTGRLIGHREGYQVDIEAIIKGAAENNKVLEINSSPDRLDLNEKNARLAADNGVKLVINTDAHDLRGMDDIEYGLAVARKAWLGPENIINTMDLPDLLEYLGRSSE